MFKECLNSFRWGACARFAAVAPVLVLVLAVGAADAPVPQWWTTHALTKIRPHDSAPALVSNAARIAAAGNEFEAFQIVLRSQNADLEGVDAEASELRGSGEAAIASKNVRIYLEPYQMLENSAGNQERADEWPDALLPRVDQYFGERRNAFPFRTRRDTNQPLWVEVYVPADTPPGKYSGQVQITADRIAPFAVPFELRVRNFKLPSTATLPTSFGLSGMNALKQHRGKYTSDEDLQAISVLYAKAALWHRISVHGGTFLPPKFSMNDGAARVDWNDYDREMGPFLNGTVFNKNEPLPGAKATSVDLRDNNQADTDGKKIAYWRAWTQHFEEKGWLDRLFFYAWDEPREADLPKVARAAKLAKQADARLRVLVTTSYSTALADDVDIWTPLINCVDSKPSFEEYCKHTVSRQAYDAALKAGKSLWWYQSCASHGCKGEGGDYFRGWPSYLVNSSAIANRVMPWISWKYRVSGELYYNMTGARDPWSDIYLFGGNGDGTLFYPGTPDRIGGHTDIPIESIRLKLIREGLEDYEYLKLLSLRGGARLADELVSKIVRATYDFENDPKAFYSVRQQLGDAIEDRGVSAELGPVD